MRASAKVDRDAVSECWHSGCCGANTPDNEDGSLLCETVRESLPLPPSAIEVVEDCFEDGNNESCWLLELIVALGSGADGALTGRT